MPLIIKILQEFCMDMTCLDLVGIHIDCVGIHIDFVGIYYIDFAKIIQVCIPA